MAELVPEFISVLRDIRDVKYPIILTKHDTVVAKEALVSPHYIAIDAVYANNANVTKVANNETNINTVSTNNANVTTTATNIANINTTAGAIANVNTTATNITNVNVVATDLALGVASNTKIVATNIANVNLTGASIAGVNTNATNIASINTNATNIVAIQNASANATTCTNAVASTNANVALTNADVVSTNADVVTCTAKAVIANQVLNMTANASTLTAGSPASASYNPTTGIMTFGIPTGPKGDKGEPFVVNAQGLDAGRSTYDTQPAGFSYFATDVSLIYFKNSATSGDWSVGAPFGKGDKGDTGNGITSITLTGTVGAVDTYRILFTDATFYDFDVTNGSVTSVGGFTGDVTKIQLAIDNIDNTSDLNKPISTATQTALNLKETVANVALKADKDNPTFTGLIKEEVSVSTLTLGATSSVQTYTATADYTIIDDLEDGEFVTMFASDAGFTPTYPTITWLDSADGTTEPPASTLTKILYEKVGATLYGTLQGRLA